jgi:hypothetical protein
MYTTTNQQMPSVLYYRCNNVSLARPGGQSVIAIAIFIAISIFIAIAAIAIATATVILIIATTNL